MKSTLFHILSSTWLIDAEVANSFFFQLHQYVNSGIAMEFQASDKKEFEARTHFVSRSSSSSSSSAAASSSQQYVAIVNIKGALMKNDQECGPYGMNTISEKIKSLKADNQCIGMVLSMDTPGGTVDGTLNLGRTIAQFGKPVVAHVDGMAASAGYWIASQADKIYFNSKLDRVGSVGVMFSTVDIRPHWEKLGVKFHDIVADESPEKNKAIFDLLRKGDDKGIKAQMSEIYAEFKSTILSKREIADDHLKGGMYSANEAINSKMADGMKSLEECIDEVVEMYDSSNNNSQTNAKTNSNMKQFARFNAALGVESLESVDGHIALNQEQITAIEAILEAGATAKSTVDTLTATVSERDATIATLQGEATQKDQTIASLQGRGADPLTSSGKGGDGGQKEESVAEREARLAALAESNFDAYLEEIQKQ
jgi:ClpP class serine protease